LAVVAGLSNIDFFTYTCSPRKALRVARDEKWQNIFSYLCIYALYGPVRNVLNACSPLRGQVVGGLGPRNRDYFGPCEMDGIEPCHLGPKKLSYR
jgi:hypothetical protein